MSAELMEALAPLVAIHVPVRQGETFDQYTARVCQEVPHPGARSMIAASIVEASETVARLAALRKSSWIARARREFEPGSRQNCAVCSKFGGITHAHHVLPLGLQYDLGMANPVQDFDWLCPNHHHAAHVFIGALLRTEMMPDLGMPPGDADALGKYLVPFTALYGAALRGKTT